MEAMTTTSPAARHRRPRRLGIEAHTEFVETLVSELDSAVAELRAAIDPAPLDRSADDLLRLVRLLEAIDGPGGQRHLELVSLPEALLQAAEGLDLGLAVRGGSGAGRFLADPEAIRLGAELVLLALAGGDEPVQVGFVNDHLVVLEGAFDLADERQVWRLRSGRRVLEGENCRVRLVGGKSGYRLEIRAFEP